MQVGAFNIGGCSKLPMRPCYGAVFAKCRISLDDDVLWDRISDSSRVDLRRVYLQSCKRGSVGQVLLYFSDTLVTAASNFIFYGLFLLQSRSQR